MITDMVDLEPLIGRYDSGLILVGPLLSHSKNSRFHYFYIAGNGNKVYQTINLGLVDVESKAQTQRADLVVKLESRFTKVLAFGSLPEMAQAAHLRWPNAETARFLAFAELEAKVEPAKVVDEAATEAIVPGKNVNDNLTFAPPWARDQRRQSGLSKAEIAPAMLRLKSPAELRDAQRLPVGDDRSLASIILRRCAVFAAVALTSAVIAWAIVRPSTPPSPASQISVDRNKEPSQAEAAVPPSVPNLHAKINEPAPQATPATVPPSPASQISVHPNKEPSQAEAAVPPSVPNLHAKINEPAPLATPATVPPSPASQISVNRNKEPSQAEAAVPPSVPNQHAKNNEPAPQAASPPSTPSQISVSPNKDSSQAEAAVPPPVPNRLTKTNEPAPSAEPTPAATVLPSKPSKVASVQSGAAPISGPQLTPAQVGGTATHLDAEEIATLVNRGTDYIKSGDLASARLLLRRAAEAGSASAALMLGTTYDPLSIQQLGAIGVVPDVAQARQWYEKAAALGSEAASQRLAKLAHSGQ